MQILKIINPENIDENSIPDWRYRKAARSVVFDDGNKIGLLHVSSQNYYKLPGGGIEEGESIEVALDRECREELGVEVKVIKEIGSIIEFREKYKLHQTSYCFLAKIHSEKKAPDFTEKEKSAGFKIIWVDADEAVRLMNLNIVSDYEGGFVEKRDSYFLDKALQEQDF